MGRKVRGQRAATWGFRETVDLISIWKRYEHALNGVKHRKKIYQRIAEEMLELGYYRDYDQCNCKINNLKDTYRRMRRTPGEAPTWCFYVAVHEILDGSNFMNAPEAYVRAGDELLEVEDDDDEDEDANEGSILSAVEEGEPAVGGSAATSPLRKEEPEICLQLDPVDFPEEPRKMGTQRAATWGFRETVDLISIWKRYDRELNSVKHRKSIYQRIAEEMLELGYYRDYDQCNNKINSLKDTYRKLRKATGDAPTWYFFPAVHDILDNNGISLTMNDYGSGLAYDEALAKPDLDCPATVYDDNEDSKESATSSIQIIGIPEADENRQPSTSPGTWSPSRKEEHEICLELSPSDIPEDPKRTALQKATLWSYQETGDLISVWKRHDKELNSVKHRKKIYQKIAEEMSELGYSRDYDQCNSKINILKDTYRKLRKTSKELPTWCFWRAVHEILDAGCWVNALQEPVQKIVHDEQVENADDERWKEVATAAVQVIGMPEPEPTENSTEIHSPEPQSPLMKEEQEICLELSPADVLEEPKKTSSQKASTWTFQEIADLISIWKRYDQELNSVRHRRPIYQKIADGMSELGYIRDYDQCNSKINILKDTYRRLRRTSDETPSWCFFHAVHEILGEGSCFAVAEASTSGTTLQKTANEEEELHIKDDVEVEESSKGTASPGLEASVRKEEPESRSLLRSQNKSDEPKKIGQPRRKRKGTVNYERAILETQKRTVAALERTNELLVQQMEQSQKRADALLEQMKILNQTLSILCSNKQKEDPRSNAYF